VNVVGIGFQAPFSELSSSVVSFQECRVLILRRVSVYSAEKLRITEEKFRGQNSLGVELLEEVTCRFRSLAHRIVGQVLLIGQKFDPRAIEV
jgi:hypothetical protein